MNAKYCPNCGQPTLVFLRKAVFGQSVFDCTSCKNITIMVAKEVPEPEHDQGGSGSPTDSGFQPPPDNEKDFSKQKPAGDEADDSDEQPDPQDSEEEDDGDGLDADDLDEEEQDAKPVPSKPQSKPEPKKPEPIELSDDALDALRDMARPSTGQDIHVQGGGTQKDRGDGEGSNSGGRSVTVHGAQHDDIDNETAQIAGKSGEYTPTERDKMKLNAFYQKLGNVMKDNQYDRLVDNLKRGSLTARNLFKVHTGSEKVFSRKLERKNKKYAVVILVDQSSSMYRGGGRNRVAAACTAALVRGLTKHRIRFGVIGFNDHAPKIHKKLGDHFGEREIASLEDKVRSCDGGTHTFEAIMEAEKMLAGRDTGEQGIVVLLTDGEPTGSYDDVCKDRFGEWASKHLGDRHWDKVKREYTAEGVDEQLTTEAEWINRGMKFIPIGIQCDTIKRWWPNAHIVHDLSKFTDIVLDEFGKVVSRG